MDTSLIAQYTGTFQSRVKKCKYIINLSSFSRQYIINILTTKQWIEVEPSFKKKDNITQKKEDIGIIKSVRHN
jgi:hypothetical protein